MNDRHVSDELPRLLTGDAGREVVMGAAAHLRSCADCQQELVSAVVAHASLMSAHRFAPEIVAPLEAEEQDDSSDPVPLPDLSTMFAEVRKDATVTAARPARHRRRLVAVAAAAAVLVGGGVTVGALEWGSSQSDSRTVQLDAFGTGKQPGSAGKIIMQGATLKFDAAKLPKLDSKHFYELWLTDSDRKNMQSVGSIGSDNKAQFTVPAKVMGQYNDFEVSVQKTNQATYSGISVLRGQYG